MKAAMRKPSWSFGLRKDLIAQCVAALLAAVVGAASIWRLHNYWVLCLFVGLLLLNLLFIALPLIGVWRLPYTDIWPSSQGAIEWLRAKLRQPSRLCNSGVEKIAIIGVACTDIGYLFEEVIEATASGLFSFKVFVVNCDDPELMTTLKDLEKDLKEVARVVQRPLAKRLRRLEARYGRWEQYDLADSLKALAKRLRDYKYKNHRECISVCEELWILAAKKGTEERKKREKEEKEEREREGRESTGGSDSGGTMEIYRMNELPFARQWVFGEQALLYSVYPGHPGVGTDNPVFCHSALDDGKVEGAPLLAKRAQKYVEQLAKECGTPYKKIPTDKEAGPSEQEAPATSPAEPSPKATHPIQEPPAPAPAEP